MTGTEGIRAGDQIIIDGKPRVVLGASGTAIRFAGDDGVVEEAALAELAGSGRLRLASRGTDGNPGARTGLAGLPPEAAEQARWWEAHIIEVVDGTRPDAPAGTPPRPAYDVERTSLRQREQAKAAELSTPDSPVAASTVKHRRQRWQAEGLPGLVDRRVTRRRTPAGRADPVVSEAMEQAIAEVTEESSRTATFIVWRTRQLLAERGETGKEPSRATMFRLFSRLSAGRHTTGSASTRRGLAGRPQRMFSQAWPAAPGELMEIDSTPLDVMVLLDDGVPARVELTGMIDVATRTVPAAVLRPSARSVDASVLLARALTPEPMRPGWPASLAMAHSALPYDRLLGIDERLRHAAARPVIVPDTIVIDHGSVFVSANFRSSCAHLGISVQPAHLATGSDKPHIERMFSSLATLFCQFAAGYLGRSADRRGRGAAVQPVWSLMQMQDLLDEWLISVWQNRAHDGLRDPLHPQRTFSPNQKYAALIETAGYVPVPLSAEDHIELLPAVWRTVNAYGIKIRHRTYDAAELNPIRQQPSGVKDGRWEVHCDPYDVSKVFVRGPGGWITCAWKYLDRVPVPFGELAWDHVSGQLAGQGRGDASELERAQAVDELLRRAYHGPPAQTPEADEGPAGDAIAGTAGARSRPREGKKPAARDRRVAARTRATSTRDIAGTAELAPAIPAGDEDDGSRTPPEDDQPVAKVIPLGIFDPFEEARKRW
ncbi:MAG: integrase [Streptosporangiaceae bacterium]